MSQINGDKVNNVGHWRFF